MIVQWSPNEDGTRWTVSRVLDPDDDNEEPDPEVRPQRFDPLHPALPAQVKRMYRLALAAGWDAWVQYAKIPKKRVDPVRWEQVARLAVCAQKPGRRVFVGWELTSTGWKADDAFLAPPWRQVKQAEAREALNAQ